MNASLNLHRVVSIEFEETARPIPAGGFYRGVVIRDEAGDELELILFSRDPEDTIPRTLTGAEIK